MFDVFHFVLCVHSQFQAISVVLACLAIKYLMKSYIQVLNSFDFHPCIKIKQLTKLN